jgi:uncharacterized membrane protein
VDSRLRVQGNPIQPMLVTLPFGLFVCATMFDLADVSGGPALLGQVGYWTLVAGLIGAALTAVAGLVDLWDASAGRTRRTALTFNLVNVAAAALFIVACLVRAGGPAHRVAGGMVAVEVVGLAVGAVGVVLGTALVRQFDQVRGEATTLDSPLATVVPVANRANSG